MQRKARRKTINPEFYIGYADDNESIEDIMQKFSYLDQIQAKNKENDNLTNDQFEDLYRKTANFKPDAIFVEHTEYSSYEDEDDAISVHSEDLRLQPVKRLKRGRPRLEADPAELAELESRFKRVKSYIQDPDAPLYVKLPNPIPRSWAKIIRPLGFDIKPMSCECKVIKADFSTFDFTNLGSDYQVCYMDPPLVNENESKLPGQLYISELAKYPIPAFVKSGFIFIWVKKQFTAKLLKIVENWGYRYIENIAWIKQNVDGSIAQEPSRLLNKSKTTCYVFRNDGDIKIQHQRNADVEFDFLKPAHGLNQEKPEYIYEIIETLLPNALDGKMIQLWARPGYSRSGWTMVENVSDDVST